MDQMNFDTDKFSEEQQDQLLLMMLIQQHQQIAMMGMGKIKNPSTDKVEREMKSAKFAIDTLVMLQKYTEGNLPKELKNYLGQTLNNLRLNYADEKEAGDEALADNQENGAGSPGDAGAGDQQE
ncbi:MAG: DUF1844 domain-containing protein [Balneolaceae bacterium]|nr:DUF1844 domain-containing protein [Balneolaceae bacterium]